ncbi:hypothetical protein A6X21_12805 [Planctopirus hydrillae]|uniref:Uncharacterized protein n=1 Tax=Planctopirus hydrillae TaxID=1841610 RepID=A0A1C3E5Z3_9PLAN|nr:hypothetical protein A6X21_12805 [Planctopirus hydrillae]
MQLEICGEIFTEARSSVGLLVFSGRMLINSLQTSKMTCTIQRKGVIQAPWRLEEIVGVSAVN